MSNSDFYTTGEAARYLGVSQSTVVNYIDKGILVPDIVMPSSNNKSGRRKFKVETLESFKETMKSRGD